MNSASHDDLNLFVARLAERSALSREDREAILSLPSQLVRIEKKRDLVHLEDESSSAFLVAAGMVARFIQTLEGARQYTAFYLPGQAFDLHGMVRSVRLGGLTALCNTSILQIPHSALREVAARHPAVAEAFWRDTMLDAAVLMQWTINVGRRNARTRLAHLFCEMAIRSGDDRSVSTDYSLPLSQEQIGDAAALTSVHVNRSLRQLDELVTVKSGEVHIRDWKALARAGDFDSSYLLADVIG